MPDAVLLLDIALAVNGYLIARVRRRGPEPGTVEHVRHLYATD